MSSVDASEESAKVAQRMFVRAAADSRPGACRQRSDSSVPGSPGPSGAAGDARSGGCPVVGTPGAVRDADCPVVTPDFNPRNFMPQASNDPGTGQRAPLGRERAASSIPIGAADSAPPGHQEAGGRVWMYPSEQMFFNAMQRKGWRPSEGDMRTVVSIHNAVNERAWSEVQRWEALHARQCGEPRLKRFQGRPNDLSPKARLLNLLGYKLPFDRHDWVVDRCGRDVRYVIDFYNAAPTPSAPVAMHLDVRPALDSPGALWDRLRMQARWVRSGRWRRE